MRAAAGTLGNPGMVTILPQITTTKPAPARSRIEVLEAMIAEVEKLLGAGAVTFE